MQMEPKSSKQISALARFWTPTYQLLLITVQHHTAHPFNSRVHYEAVDKEKYNYFTFLRCLNYEHMGW